MFRSSLNFFSGSWDTSFARQFLRIPKDQLDMINSIPEWSTQEISNKSAGESKSTFEETDNQSIVKTAQLKNCCPNSISAKNIDILGQQGDNSLPKFKAVAISVEKETILRNLSSSAKKKKSTFGVLKRSQSLTDIYQAPESIKIFPHRKSADFKRYLAMSTGESFSCPLEYSDLSSKKKNLEKLDESILNHRYLKGIKSTSAVMSLKSLKTAGKEVFRVR
ncbi:hypothetical protein CEXT_736451 [Caerostris extrusa]|uniref:Uncharacterized protein n=1 Tax=Caerostris extrusa TaxID=172846 RepID=A0AAV4QW99_CAEEX|nr:hypothetical protein CEXT_736451 [Caerostris extrusa]